MKERPILFKGPMVQAILEGRKTQTRLVVKPQPTMGRVVQRNDGVFRDGGTLEDSCIIRCPFGVPGDRLWVRETWQRKWGGGLLYKADHNPPEEVASAMWKPSIHMPREACRLTLEVVGVRVERLQEISEADAKAEGYDDTRDSAGGCFELTTARENFLGAPWAVSVGPNPWVWVVEFRRIEP